MRVAICMILAGTLFAGYAHAGEMEGTVQSVDKDKHMIMMEDGMSVMTTKDVMLDNVMKGDKVKVTTDKDNMATKVEKE